MKETCPICGYDEDFWEDKDNFICRRCGTEFNENGDIITEGTWDITEEIENLLSKKLGIDNKVEEMVGKLHNAGGDCYCGYDDYYEYIHHGNWDEIHHICLACGGYKDYDSGL